MLSGLWAQVVFTRKGANCSNSSEISNYLVHLFSGVCNHFPKAALPLHLTERDGTSQGRYANMNRYVSPVFVFNMLILMAIGRSCKSNFILTNWRTTSSP